jgi:hypothetical protein
VPVFVTIATVFIFGGLAGAGAWIVWRREGNLADQLSRSLWIWIPLAIVLLILAALLTRLVPSPWVPITWGILALVGVAGFPLAAAITDTRSLRQDNSRRRALGLASRQVLLPTRAVGALWAFAAVAYFLLFTLVVVPVADHYWYRPGNPSSSTTAGILLGAFLTGLVAILIAGIIHWKFIHPRRVHADEQRIRSDDLQTLQLDNPAHRAQQQREGQPEAPPADQLSPDATDRTPPTLRGLFEPGWRDIGLGLSPTIIGALFLLIGPSLTDNPHARAWGYAGLLTGLTATALLAAGHLLFRRGRNTAGLNAAFAGVLAALAVGLCLVGMLL